MTKMYEGKKVAELWPLYQEIEKDSQLLRTTEEGRAIPPFRFEQWQETEVFWRLAWAYCYAKGGQVVGPIGGGEYCLQMGIAFYKRFPADVREWFCEQCTAAIAGSALKEREA